MPKDDLETLARLRGLLDVSRVVRDEEALPDMLRAIARTIAESLGLRLFMCGSGATTGNNMMVV